MGKLTRGLKNAMMQDDDVVAAKLLWKGAKAVAGGVAVAADKTKGDKKKGSGKEPEAEAQSGGYRLEDHASDSQDGTGSKSDSLD